MLNDLHTLHVAVLCSKRAPGLGALLHHPLAGLIYRVECVITTEPAFAKCRVPVLTHPIRAFYDQHNASLRDRSVRQLYDQNTAEVLRRLGIDVVLLLGYLYVVTSPLLAGFPGRILNLHDSDLTLRNKDGSPRYAGLHATRDSILGGEKATRSSAHIVTNEVDGGPVLVQSEAFPVAPFVHAAVGAEEDDIIRAYAYAHREWMMRSSWGDLAVRALEHVATGLSGLVPSQCEVPA